jgi:hypothetical protein
MSMDQDALAESVSTTAALNAHARACDKCMVELVGAACSVRLTEIRVERWERPGRPTTTRTGILPLDWLRSPRPPLALCIIDRCDAATSPSACWP